MAKNRISTLTEHIGELILRAYRPLRFETPTSEEPLTLAELANRSGWNDAVNNGLADSGENLLEVTGLRTSRLFPRHLLHRNADGRTVLLTEAAAIGLIRVELLRRAADRAVAQRHGTIPVTGSAADGVFEETETVTAKPEPGRRAR